LKLTNVKIRRKKLTHYLLLKQEQDDKSGYLALAGFTLETAGDLMRGLERLAREGEAFENRTNEYGVLLHVDGQLIGPNGRRLGVRTIWIKRSIDDETHFVTLVPLEVQP
jgi:hypothetical protein